MANFSDMSDFLTALFRKVKKIAGRILVLKKPFWLGPLIGGLIGIVGGFAGVFIGLLMGLLLQKLTEQIYDDKALLSYFENPGSVRFAEAEPGLAAFCALGMIVLYESSRSAKEFRIEDLDALTFKETIVRHAISTFELNADDIPLIESYCRLASSRFMLLNADLLAESLIARRKKEGGLDKIGAVLEHMSFGDGIGEARYIRSLLDPSFKVKDDEKTPNADDASPANPWIILGLEPTASAQEIKATYRKLATQFHPDQLQFLDKERQLDAEKAFMKIKEAYREALAIISTRNFCS